MKDDSKENPRTRRVRRLILDTAVEVLLECGAHVVTASVVAERADVARTTIYRYWPDHLSLVLAAIDQLTTPHVPEGPAGPLSDDVRVALEQLRTRLLMREVRAVFGALAGYAAQDETFEEAQRLFVMQLTQPMVDVLEAAQGRGEFDSDGDCAFEATLLVGPILHQHLAVGGEVSDRLIEEVSRRWLLSIGQT